MSVVEMEANLALARGDAPLSDHERRTMRHIRENVFDGRSFAWEGAEVQSYWVKYGKAHARDWYAAQPQPQSQPRPTTLA
ncbi:hypothetical protein EON67_04140 [archaeon]|nr:MAG: hypothetical protein EON67_04140 [archaeon]